MPIEFVSSSTFHSYNSRFPRISHGNNFAPVSNSIKWYANTRRRPYVVMIIVNTWHFTDHKIKTDTRCETVVSVFISWFTFDILINYRFNWILRYLFWRTRPSYMTDHHIILCNLFMTKLVPRKLHFNASKNRQKKMMIYRFNVYTLHWNYLDSNCQK